MPLEIFEHCEPQWLQTTFIWARSKFFVLFVARAYRFLSDIINSSSILSRHMIRRLPKNGIQMKQPSFSMKPLKAKFALFCSFYPFALVDFLSEILISARYIQFFNGKSCLIILDWFKFDESSFEWICLVPKYRSNSQHLVSHSFSIIWRISRIL